MTKLKITEDFARRLLGGDVNVNEDGPYGLGVKVVDVFYGGAILQGFIVDSKGREMVSFDKYEVPLGGTLTFVDISKSFTLTVSTH